MKTKEEAKKSLQNTKVYVAGKSDEIQKKLFELGFRFKDNTNEIQYTDFPFLYISSDKIDFGNSMSFFTRSEKTEIAVDYILDLSWKEVLFKPFDKVLVRNSNNENWRATFYSHQSKGGFVTTCGYYWDQCISYKGNEKLVGTTKSK